VCRVVCVGCGVVRPSMPICVRQWTPESLESRARQDRRAMSALEQALGGPAIEVVAKATRRRFTVEYKRKIVRDADGCKAPGAVGALLRREGLYSSHLTTWRAARERGELAGAPKKRGPRGGSSAGATSRSPDTPAR